MVLCKKLMSRILEYAELEGNGRILGLPSIEEYSPAQVREHVTLCSEAGYLKVREKHGEPYAIVRLTWSGHQFLKQNRNLLP